MSPAAAQALVDRVLAADKARRLPYRRNARVLYAALVADDPEALAYIQAQLDGADGAETAARADHVRKPITAAAASRPTGWPGEPAGRRPSAALGYGAPRAGGSKNV